MASTFSPLKVELIATGEQSGTWGTTTNVNLGTALGEAITGSADVTFASGDVTVTLTNVNTTQIARNLRLNLVGTSSGTHSLILGSGCDIEKLYLVNNTLANPVIVVNTAGGTSITVPAGKSMFVYNTGTNIVDAVTHVTSLTSGTITGTTITASTGFTGALTGNAATATTLQTARLIGGVSFNGSADINLPGVNQTGNQNTTGSAATLTTARTINGTSFNGSANITTANWGTARTLWGQSVNGSANITAPLLPAAGTAAAPAFSTSGDTNTGVFFPAADTLAFAEGGAEAMRIDSAGNVGIGTTTPTAKISVAGTGGFTGSVTAPTFIGDLTGNADTATALRAPSVNPTLDLDFANNDYTIYDSFANSYTDKPYADMLTVTNGVATGFDAIGLLRNSVANNIRLVFDPVTGVPQGALVEPTATYYARWSEDLSNVYWVLDGATKSGTDTIETTSGVVVTLASQTETVPNASFVYAYWEFSKANYTFGDELTLNIDNGQVTIRARAIFTVSTKTFTFSNTSGFANTTGIYKDFGDTFIVGLITQTPGTTARMRMFATPDATGNTVMPRRQLVGASALMSYIKTEASTVTRVADQITRTLGGEFNPNEGTLYAEGVFVQNTSQAFILLHDGTNNNRIQLSLSATGRPVGFINKSNVIQFNQDVNLGNISNTKVKLAISYKENSAFIVANGVASAVDTTVELPVVDRMRVGSIEATTAVLNGTIADAQYYPRALTQAECIALTTL
jgi:hypothetical protein